MNDIQNKQQDLADYLRKAYKEAIWQAKNIRHAYDLVKSNGDPALEVDDENQLVIQFNEYEKNY